MRKLVFFYGYDDFDCYRNFCAAIIGSAFYIKFMVHKCNTYNNFDCCSLGKRF